MPVLKFRNKKAILADLAASYLSIANRDVNDLNEGSVLRTLLEIIAEEHEETDFNIAASYYRSVLSYAGGIDLDRIGEEEGSTRHAAAGASGIMRLSKDAAAGSDSPVAAAGSIVVTNGTTQYRNTSPCRIFLGQTAWVVDDGVYTNNNIPFEAVVSGPNSDSAANTIDDIVAPVSQLDTVINPQSFSGGRREESDNDYRFRISLARDRRAGASRPALLAAVLEQSDIYSAAVYEWTSAGSSKFVRPSPGEVWIYVFQAFAGEGSFVAGQSISGESDLYSEDPQNLLDRTRNAVEPVRGFPMTVKVKSAFAVLVSPIIDIVLPRRYKLNDTDSAVVEIQQRLRNYLLALKIGESLSEGQIFAVVGQVVPFKSISLSLVVERNRTHYFSEEIEGGQVAVDESEIIKPGIDEDAGTFGVITISNESD